MMKKEVLSKKTVRLSKEIGQSSYFKENHKNFEEIINLLLGLIDK